MDYALFTFETTSAAIAAQKLLADLDPIVMPTLREISSGCGISLRLRPEQAAEAGELLNAASIPWRLYAVRHENKKYTAELIRDNIGTSFI